MSGVKQQDSVFPSATVPAIIKFALPSICTMIAMGLYTIIDTIFISRFVNTDALSAINIVCPMINGIVGAGTMIATGGSAIIARQLGKGSYEQARQNFTFLFLFSIVLGGMIAIAGWLVLEELILFLGANEILLPYGKAYLGILLIFTPVSLIQLYMQSMMITAGFPSMGLWLSIGAGIVNIGLDYLFIVQLDMGIGGAALGTGCGYAVASLIACWFFFHTKKALYFVQPVCRWRVLWKSCTNGSSELVSQGAAAISTFLFNTLMMRFAQEQGVAAVTIMIYTQFLFTTLFLGFSMGVAPIIAYQYGREDHQELRRLLSVCLKLIAIMTALTFLMTKLLAPALVSLFAKEDVIVYAMALQGFQIFSYGFLFCGWTIFASSLFTAFSNGKLSAFISFMRTFVFIVLFLLVLPELLGMDGVLLAQVLAEGMSCVLAFALMYAYRSTYHYG